MFLGGIAYDICTDLVPIVAEDVQYLEEVIITS